MPINDYTTLMELEGWTFLLEPKGGPINQDYIFLAHTICPKGVQLEIYNETGITTDSKPSVMHYHKHVCQRCEAEPPEGLFGVYTLYQWGTGAFV